MYAGKVVFITGASGGIGAHLARMAHRRGAKVAIVARSKAKLLALAAELGDNVLALEGDVCAEGSIESAVAATLDKWGALDVCIANAGIAVNGALEALTVADFERQFATNVSGVLRTIYAALPALKASRGHLAVIGSVAGSLALPAAAPYSMSKAAVQILCGALKHELAPHGIRVLHVAPGFIASDIRLRDRTGVVTGKIHDPVPPWLVMPGDTAARKILDAIAAGRTQLTLTFHGKFILALARYFPALVDLIIGKFILPNSAKLGL